MANPGDAVLVRYNLPGPVVWHERVILFQTVNPGEYGALDPDLDSYAEDLSQASPNIAGILLSKV